MMPSEISRQTILVGEDESVVRGFLDMTLRSQGYNVEMAGDGNEVLARLREPLPVDAVLLDVMMPSRDGLETLREIRRLDSNLPVIMLSCLSTPVTVVEAMKVGANDFLAKPVTHERLRLALKKVLDGGGSQPVFAPDGRQVGEVGTGSRKDIRDAVAAARAAQGWSKATAHNRSQVLFYLAENLAVRADEFARQLGERAGMSADAAQNEVDLAVQRLFTYAAWADKFDGAVRQPPLRGVALAMHEPLGVIGIGCPAEHPLLAFVSLLAPAIALGNRVVVVPHPSAALTATDFYQIVETSDVPAGVVNIVTGDNRALLAVLAAHDDVDAVWSFGDSEQAAEVERLSIGNLKRTFVDYGRALDWQTRESEGFAFLRQAVQVKNIWIPYGD